MQTRAQLEQENSRIRAQLLQKESLHKAQIDSKDTLIEQLKEALILERHRQFVKITESLRSLQRELFNEPESILSDNDIAKQTAQDVIEVPAHKRQRSGRKPLPEDLPRINVFYDLNEHDKVCPHDGHTLTEIGVKTSEQLDIIPMKIQVIRHVRKQYACPCCQSYLKPRQSPSSRLRNLKPVRVYFRT